LSRGNVDRNVLFYLRELTYNLTPSTNICGKMEICVNRLHKNVIVIASLLELVHYL
jgi:hypothetical protein